jgi:hypothetical protein
VAPDQREEELLSRGWKRQFVADEPRLSEAAALYRSLGMEVLLEPLPTDPPGGECRSCLDAAPGRFRIIYTRVKEEGSVPGKDDLF